MSLCPDFDEHPGHDVECPLQITVHPHPMGTSHRGYGCYATGGHCVPDGKCEERVKNEEKIMPEKVTIQVFTFDELNEHLQSKALQDVCQYFLEAEPEHPSVQKAVEEAEDLMAPWFSEQILLENDPDLVYEEARRPYYDRLGRIVEPYY